jgi:hypothetical protein
LAPLEGTKSLWCGARANPSDERLCSYLSLPGYGNNWRQAFCTNSCLAVSGQVSLTFKASWDLESEYDFFTPQFSLCDEAWVDAESFEFSGFGEQTFTTIIPSAQHSGDIKFRFFVSTDPNWSDEDGLLNTDGAVIIDSVTVKNGNGVVLATELFESESVGATETTSGKWAACNDFGFGDHVALMSGTSILEEDYCKNNVSCLWTFYFGSSENYGCGGFPLQPAVPHANARGQYIANEIWSPVITLAEIPQSILLQFDVYRDLPMDNLVAYLWHVRSFDGDCPGAWVDDATAYFGEKRDWFRHTVSISPFLQPGLDAMQVALGVRDMCRFWCGKYGSGACHSHSPLFDNVRILQVDVQGPQWFVRPGDLFQDSFPGDGTTTGVVRADIAQDVLPSGSGNVIPGDSSVVAVEDAASGIAPDAFTGTGSAVYGYVQVRPTGQAGKTGSSLSGDPQRYPYTGSLSIAGETWYRLRADSVRFGDTTFHPLYCLDLNDQLFTPGDTVEFFFGAINNDGVDSYWSSSAGTTEDVAQAATNAMEFTCLPTIDDFGDGILYIDDCDGSGDQLWFDEAFEFLALGGQVDRFDIRASSSALGNGPATRVSDLQTQVLPYYSTIIWSSGSMESNLVGDGAADKSDDYHMLHYFLNDLDRAGGVYLTGDNLATELAYSSNGFAIDIRSYYVTFSLAHPDHVAYGEPVSPLVVGLAGGCFSDVSGPDTIVAFGGCPTVASFDVLTANGTATAAARYSGTPGHGAVVTHVKTNAVGTEVGVVLSGFGFHHIRDYAPLGVPSHAIHLQRVLSWLGHVVQDPTAVGRSSTSSVTMAQNYPNPFNPSTWIRFGIPSSARVRIVVYDVQGRTVRTLIDEDLAAAMHEVTWDGTDDTGSRVASGIYFCKLDALDQSLTRKVMLLK